MTRTESTTSSMSHRLTFESPDTLYIELVGPLTVAHAQVLIKTIHELGQQHGPLYWIIDVAKFSMSGERVRDVFLAGGRERYPIRAGIMCGAPFAVRVAMTMALTAGMRITPKSFSFPFRFMATADEARELIASQRRATMPPPEGNDFQMATAES
ncbi:MAG TPA: hypothetical protein PK156_03875 [Polyangium sp.]|nr:hypothetical protein [Polyangium sp.]